MLLFFLHYLRSFLPLLILCQSYSPGVYVLPQARRFYLPSPCPNRLHISMCTCSNLCVSIKSKLLCRSHSLEQTPVTRVTHLLFVSDDVFLISSSTDRCLKMNSPNCRPACFRGRVACGLCELLLILLGDFHVLLYFLEVSFIALISLKKLLVSSAS